jgi:CheY-like chemotaxis protein
LPSKRQVDQQHLSLEGARVLVVEDTWHVAKALKSALEQVGMDVSGPAATTAEARRLMAEQMPRVAVVANPDALKDKRGHFQHCLRRRLTHRDCFLLLRDPQNLSFAVGLTVASEAWNRAL